MPRLNCEIPASDVLLSSSNFDIYSSAYGEVKITRTIPPKLNDMATIWKIANVSPSHTNATTPVTNGVNMLKSWNTVKGSRCTDLVTNMKVHEPAKHLMIKGVTKSLFNSLKGS